MTNHDQINTKGVPCLSPTSKEASAADRHRRVVRQSCWDGGIRRLLPEMTYTATGFSNPVRVVFDAIQRPKTIEDRRETGSISGLRFIGGVTRRISWTAGLSRADDVGLEDDLLVLSQWK